LTLRFGQLTPNFLTNLWKEKPKLTPLFSALYGFNLLTYLQLSLSGVKLSTPEAKHFSLVLKELKQLETFSIMFLGFDPENKYQGFRIFLASLKEIPKLSSLTMLLREEKMGDEEVRFLGENLQGCQCLRSLILGFYDTDKLTEDSLQYLSIGLKGLLLLKELRLIFERKKAFKKESTSKFLESLTALKYLESLSLIYYPREDESEIQDFAKDLVEKKKFRRLTQFVLNHGRI